MMTSSPSRSPTCAPVASTSICPSCVTFGRPCYSGQGSTDATLSTRRRLHQQTPLATEHFVRWLTLWNSTIDQIYQGPVAEHAKTQAARIATAMHRRLTGTRAPQPGVPANPN